MPRKVFGREDMCLDFLGDFYLPHFLDNSVDTLADFAEFVIGRDLDRTD